MDEILGSFRGVNKIADPLEGLGSRLTPFKFPILPSPQRMSSFEECNLASEFYKRLVEWINNFDQSLDKEHEVGARLVSFGREVVFHLEDITYWNPSLIAFIGTAENGDPVELIQHVSQISILLVKLKRKNPEEPKRKIGFMQNSDDKE